MNVWSFLSGGVPLFTHHVLTRRRSPNGMALIKEKEGSPVTNLGACELLETGCELSSIHGSTRDMHHEVGYIGKRKEERGKVRRRATTGFGSPSACFFIFS